MNFLEGTITGSRLRLGSHALELPEMLTRAEGRVIVGLRPEDFVLNGGGGNPIAASVEVSERLGPEVLVRLRAKGVRVATIGERAAKSEDEESGELLGTIVARFDPGFSAQPGDTVSLDLNRERLQFFDPESGSSLRSAA